MRLGEPAALLQSVKSDAMKKPCHAREHDRVYNFIQRKGDNGIVQEGFEPSRLPHKTDSHRIINPARLPVPPLSYLWRSNRNLRCCMELPLYVTVEVMLMKYASFAGSALRSGNLTGKGVQSPALR